MGKNLLVGVGSKARKVKALYVGVGGKARKVKKVYVGVGGKARLVYQSYIPVTSISVTGQGVSNTFNTYYFSIALVPSNATNQTVTWNLSEVSYSGGLKILAYGNDYCKIEANGPNFVPITATLRCTSADSVYKEWKITFYKNQFSVT